MCTVCGCEQSQHDHEHHHHHHGEAGGDLDYSQGPARAHAPGMDQAQLVEIERGILSKNDAYAQTNRLRLAGLGVTALNLVSSPGSGKTTFLVKTLSDQSEQYAFSVIEGDQQTTNDADRIRATGVPAIQVNTGKGCHLDAHQVGHAIDHLDPKAGGVMFIENVGNLVCPAAFDLGEACKVALLSVTEGEDKPLKYPDMFAGSRLLVLTKIDLLPYVDFDVDRCIEYARRINPQIQVIQVSAKTGEGLSHWYRWLELTHATQQLGATA